MSAQPLSSTAETRLAQQAAGDAGDAFTFRAPRYGDLVVCPYCDADNPDPRFRCDYCGDEGVIYASEVPQ